MKKLFVAVAAVMVVSATAFSNNNKMTNKGVDEPDTVVVDSNKTQALVDDTVTSDTVVTTDESAFALALVDDTVTSDTVVTADESAFALALVDDTVTSDTVVTADESAFALALVDDTVTSDTVVTADESAFALALVDDTVTSDTVVVNTEKIALAKNEDEVEPDTTNTEKKKVEEVIEKAENKIRFMA